MIENAPLLAALAEKARQEGVALRSSAVADVSPAHASQSAGEGSGRGSSHVTEVELADGGVLSARLLVAADGAHSAIRERAGIACHGWNYGQSAIVTTVAHERDHNGRAEEHFLPAGPFAILPLKSDAAGGHRSSIVWTEEAQEAARIVALPDAGFHAELERRFGLASRRDRSGRPAPRSSARPLGRARHSLPIASRSSAMPPMSFIRSRGRDSIWDSKTSPRLPK